MRFAAAEELDDAIRRHYSQVDTEQAVVPEGHDAAGRHAAGERLWDQHHVEVSMLQSERRLGFIEGALSIIINTSLFVLKLRVGTAAGSVAVVADAWHTLSDTITSLIVIGGFWIASRPQDREHPFGHGRAEVIAAVVIGTLLGVVGFGFLRESYLQLREYSPADFSRATVIVFAISVVLKEGIAQFSIRAGRATGSRALVADGWHHRSDAIASALILVGALLGRQIWWVDGALGIAVSLLIVYAAVEIIRDAAKPLMGEPVDKETSATIRRIVGESFPAITDVHHLHVHRYGPHAELTMHARVAGSTPVDVAHQIASRVEQRLRQELSVESTVHLEPHSTDTESGASHDSSSPQRGARSN